MPASSAATEMTNTARVESVTLSCQSSQMRPDVLGLMLG
jgi:hypothetical protein